MADMLDKFITLGIGLEKKATEALGELEKLGTEAIDEEEAKEKKEEGGKGLAQRRSLRTGSLITALRPSVSSSLLLTDCREKAEGDVRGSGEKVMDKLHVASKEDA